MRTANILVTINYFQSYLQGEFARAAARAVVELSRDIESLRGRMGESTRQVEGLFESLLTSCFEEKQ